MKIELLRGPMEQVFERDRKILLLVVAVGVAVAWAGFIPQGFDVLGIKSGEIDPTGFTAMLALVILYFLVACCAHAIMDWKAWQWRLIDGAGERTFETLSELNAALTPERGLTATASGAFFSNKIVFAKVLFDMVLPVVVGMYALAELSFWEPPAAKMVAVVHAEPDEEKKSTLVFVNSGATIVGETDAEGLATIIVPFAKEARCDANSSRDWSGAAVDDLHQAFLARLGLDLSSCGTRDNPVRLRVMGFASSSQVKDFAACDGARSSEEANLRIAEARRDNVIHYLSRNKSEFLQIEAHDWGGDFDKMRQQRRYLDRLLGDRYSKERGQLNRRVDIALLHTGECELAER